MSGIAGFVRLSGPSEETADRPEIAALLADMAYRAPDGGGSWQDASCGLAFAGFDTGGGGDAQPLARQSRTVIVGDLRLDGRDDLVDTLRARVGASAGELSGLRDAALVLETYAAFGLDFASRVLGDFALAIWDAEAARLVAARDPFGVKPFYYAVSRGFLVFGNTFQAVRRQTQGTRTLDERAVGEYLLLGECSDPEATLLCSIRRLPPGHLLVVEAGGVRTSKFFSFEPQERASLRPADYVERFRDLLDKATADRMGGGPQGIELSGGMDSTAVAEALSRLAARAPRSIRGFHLDAGPAVPDLDRPFADLVAAALGIPLKHLASDRRVDLDEWMAPAFQRRLPFPSASPLARSSLDNLREVGAACRVLVTGQGGDEVLRPPRRHFNELFGGGRFLSFATATVRYALKLHRPPPVGFRAALGRLRKKTVPMPEFPRWIQPDFARRHDLEARWREIRLGTNIPTGREELLAHFAAHLLPTFFERLDPGHTGVPVEFRHPLLDLRVLRFLLSIEPVPWLYDKTLVREALRGRIPELVRKRPKTPLPSSPLPDLMRRVGRQLLDVAPAPGVERFVDRSAIPDPSADAFGETDVHAFCFNLWLGSGPLSE